jgi:hypothetical protein
MQATRKFWGRSHPVRLAALIGAIVGFTYSLVIEVGGAFHRNSSAVILMLGPAYAPGSSLSQGRIAQSALILFIEFTVNILVWALIFSLPVALIVLIRRAIQHR